MRESRTLRRWAAPLVVALCIPAAGCTGAVSSWQVEASITTELHHLGVDAVDVRCPHNLQAVVGEDVWCSFVVAGQPVDAVVTVVAIDSGRARFSIVPKARPIGRTLLEQRLAGDIPQHAGGTPESVECDADLPAAADAAVSCSLGDNRRVTVRVTAVRGGEVDYSVLEL